MSHSCFFYRIWVTIDFFHLISVISYSESLESLSLITTREFSLLLFIVVRLYYTSDRKYFYICKILRVCSFKWYDHGLSSSRNSGEISGLRSGTASVVIRSSFPNNDSQPFFVPNNDTLTKFKGKHISLKKNVFSCFLLEIKQRCRWHFCRAYQALLNSKGSLKTNVD